MLCVMVLLAGGLAMGMWLLGFCRVDEIHSIFVHEHNNVMTSCCFVNSPGGCGDLPHCCQHHVWTVSVLVTTSRLLCYQCNGKLNTTHPDGYCMRQLGIDDSCTGIH